MVRKRFFWPPLSDEPKIEYIEYLQTDYDLQKSHLSSFELAVFGREVPSRLFSSPNSIYSNGQGLLYITEVAGGFVRVLDLNKGKQSKLRDREGKVYSFRLPVGVNGDRHGNVYVCDSLGKKILVFGPDGTQSGEWIGPHFTRPVNIAVDDLRRRAYIAEPDRHTLVVVDTESGGFIEELGGRGVDEGRFNFPLDVDLDSDGNIYVLDSMNARVQKFSSDGRFLLSFGERGTAIGSFQLPKSLSVSPEGHIYVADSMAHKVVVFDSAGRYLITFGGKFPARAAVAPGGLYLPQSIDVDSLGRIWVVDGLNRLVHRFQYLNSGYLDSNPIQPGQAVDPFSGN